MTSETKLAFAHPEERSKASAAQPLDRLSLRDHQVEVEIGAFQAERDVTQRLSFNVVVEIAPLPKDLDDDVDRILSYDRLTEAIAHELAAERLNLLETLADRIAARVLLEPQAERVFVRIEKLDRGPGALGVEVVRAAQHDTAAAQRSAQIDGLIDGMSPRVVFLSDAAQRCAQVPGWIDQIGSWDVPTVICVDLPEPAVQPAPQATAQRHIELLSIEQNAWRLAARDERAVVVGSRTELDWALKNRQISIWAPAKIVLDAVEGPKVKAYDGLTLDVVVCRNLWRQRCHYHRCDTRSDC
ncbi:hypothetical protein GQR58_030524 [Nymphon striatum]|nr:hypothetical protein GQR58_030524 [Nymphon striatum]